MDARSTLSRRGLLAVMAGMAAAAVASRLGRAQSVMASGGGTEGAAESTTGAAAPAAVIPGHATHAGAPLTFTAVVEVKPEIVLAEYTGVEVQHAPQPVTDDDVEQTVERGEG